ncbi:hypothetical protein ACLOJK_007748 [Asimina triloba]
MATGMSMTMTSSNRLPRPSLPEHFLSLLEKCVNLSHLKQLQSHLVTLDHAHLFAFKLVRFCILSLSNLDYARFIFYHLDCPDVYLHAAMITAYASQSVHAQILKFGFEEYRAAQNALVDSYAKCSDLGTAHQKFDGMQCSVYARVGMVGDAVLLFEEMPERNVPSWNAMIAGCAQNGFFSEAISLFQRMLLVSGGHEERPKQITVLGFVATAVVDMYGKCGSLKEATRLFNRNSERSLTLWNSIINCVALHGQSEKAIAIFKEMESLGFKPDEFTFMGLLNACTHRGLVEEGRSYFVSMSRDYNIEPEIEHYGCVIDLLS